MNFDPESKSEKKRNLGGVEGAEGERVSEY